MNRQLNTISISCNLLYEAMAYKKFAKAMAMSVLIKNKVTSSTVVGYTKKELCDITDCDFRTVKKHLKILREYGMVREDKIKKRKDITFLSLKDKKAEKNTSFANISVRVFVTVMLVLIRPISGSAALAVGTDLMARYGVDSTMGRTAAVMLGSTETTFYTISVYFGAAGIKRTRYTLPAALIADFTGFLMASLTARLFYS